MAQVDAAGVQQRLRRFDLSRGQSQILTVQIVRLGFLAIVLSLTVIYQISNARFIPFEIFFSVYILLGISFFINCLYILFLDYVLKHPFWTASSFLWESIYISLLIYFIGINQSLFILLYLINIILCGVVFKRRGTVYLALFTSVLFSFLLSMDQKLSGASLYLAAGMNHLAFFTVAYLSGYLGEQLNFMGLALRERGQDIRVLRNLNSLILENISSGLLTVDLQGMILQYNQNAMGLLGQTEELKGKSLVHFFPEKLLSSDFGSTQDLEYEDPRGFTRILRVQRSSLKDENLQMQGLIFTFDDVTHVIQLQSRVLQSEKMAAIGQLAAGIAHEIRNPLASISGSVQLLQGNNQLSSEDHKLMAIIVREIDRLNKLITEFLDYARPKKLVLVKLQLSQLLNDVVDAIRLDPRFKDVDFEIDIQKNIEIEGGADALKQAFWNIIINGLQAMEKKEFKKIKIGLKKDQHVHLSIRDTGVGIPADQLHRIFEPFHTTKPKGTGLGLAIVHSILETHRALVDVKSELGEWTEFIIEFP